MLVPLRLAVREPFRAPPIRVQSVVGRKIVVGRRQIGNATPRPLQQLCGALIDATGLGQVPKVLQRLDGVRQLGRGQQIGHFRMVLGQVAKVGQVVVLNKGMNTQ